MTTSNCMRRIENDSLCLLKALSQRIDRVVHLGSAAEEDMELDGDYYDLNFLLGKTKRELKYSDKCPEGLKALCQREETSIPISGFGSGAYVINAGDLVFLSKPDKTEQRLVQVMASCLVNTRSQRIEPPPLLAFSATQFARMKNDGSRLLVTGITTDTIIPMDSYVANSSFVRYFQQSVLDHLAPFLSRSTKRGLLKRFFSNTRAGYVTLKLYPFGMDCVELRVLQVVANCFIILHHWIRYDLDNDARLMQEQCAAVAFTTSVPMTQAPLLVSSRLCTNLFSLEACINDWIYFWVYRVKADDRRNDSVFQEFKAEMEVLMEPDTWMRDLRMLVLYAVQDPKNVDIGMKYASNALKMALTRTIYAVGTTAEERCQHFIDNAFKTAVPTLKENCIHELVKTEYDPLQLIHAIGTSSVEHASMLCEGDIIVVNGSNIAKVVKLSVVDPCLSLFRSSMTWREQVQAERDAVAQDDEDERIQYLCQRTKAVLAMSEQPESTESDMAEDPRTVSNGDVEMGSVTDASVTMSVFQRASMFFAVRVMQVTYYLLTGAQGHETTINIGDIKLLGNLTRPIGYSRLSLGLNYDELRTCCICGKADPTKACCISMTCGHFFHEDCAYVGGMGMTPYSYMRKTHFPRHCPFCYCTSDIQRKGAQVD